MQGIIGFDHYKITCIIGTNPEERDRAQDIYIDLKVEADFSRCAQSGKLEDTIDYRQLADVCKKLAEEGRYHILEKYAFDVLEALAARFDYYWIWIKVKKPQALAPATFTFVELQKFKYK